MFDVNIEMGMSPCVSVDLTENRQKKIVENNLSVIWKLGSKKEKWNLRVCLIRYI